LGVVVAEKLAEKDACAWRVVRRWIIVECEGQGKIRVARIGKDQVAAGPKDADLEICSVGRVRVGGVVDP